MIDEYVSWPLGCRSETLGTITIESTCHSTHAAGRRLEGCIPRQPLIYRRIHRSIRSRYHLPRLFIHLWYTGRDRLPLYIVYTANQSLPIIRSIHPLNGMSPTY